MKPVAPLRNPPATRRGVSQAGKIAGGYASISERGRSCPLSHCNSQPTTVKASLLVVCPASHSRFPGPAAAAAALSRIAASTAWRVGSASITQSHGRFKGRFAHQAVASQDDGLAAGRRLPPNSPQQSLGPDPPALIVDEHQRVAVAIDPKSKIGLGQRDLRPQAIDAPRACRAAGRFEGIVFLPPLVGLAVGHATRIGIGGRHAGRQDFAGTASDQKPQMLAQRTTRRVEHPAQGTQGVKQFGQPPTIIVRRIEPLQTGRAAARADRLAGHGLADQFQPAAGRPGPPGGAPAFEAHGFWCRQGIADENAPVEAMLPHDHGQRAGGGPADLDHLAAGQLAAPTGGGNQPCREPTAVAADGDARWRRRSPAPGPPRSRTPWQTAGLPGHQSGFRPCRPALPASKFPVCWAGRFARPWARRRSQLGARSNRACRPAP